MPNQSPSIPPHGSYFLASSSMDNLDAYTCVTLYQIDRSAGIRLQAKANLKHSVPLANWLGDFEPDLVWFTAREIRAVTETEALEIVSKHEAFDRLLARAEQHLVPTSFMINDGLSNRNPQYSKDLVLNLAKLAKPISLHGCIISHISKAGDLIHKIDPGLSAMSYLDVTLKDLLAFVTEAECAGFAPLEKTLSQIKSTAKLRAV